jgi:curli biogenesis system outer membrane secretion channel CsgG
MRNRSACVVLMIAMIATMLGASTDVLAQAKTRIAVTAFENKVKQPSGDPSWKIGEGLAEMLTSELVKTGQFIVVERQGLGDVVGEQALGQSGLVRGETVARPGQLLGAQVVVRGAVTEFEEQASGGGAGVRRAALLSAIRSAKDRLH